MIFKRMLIPAIALTMSMPAMAADTVKIGFVTTLTTGAGVIGRDMAELGYRTPR